MKETSLSIIDKLNKHGYQAYIIGGFVRDYLLGKTSYDVDICTDATPKEVQQVFKEAIISKFEYGSVHLKIKNIDYEITTFRKEIKYLHNRKPIEIEYIKDLKEDLLRRDFTINTICMDNKGNIIDLLDGRKDLDNKLIKTIKSADLIIQEDSLRILRAIRFATSLDFAIDDELFKAIKSNKKLLKELSYERKKDELSRIFMNENKSYAIDLIEQLDLKTDLEIDNLKEVLLTNDILGIWALIDINNKYMFTKGEKSIINNIRNMLQEGINNYTIYKYGSYVTTIVGDIKQLKRQELLDKYDKLPIKTNKDIQINTIEICSILNKEPGPYLKDIFNDLEYQITMEQLPNDYDDLKNYIITKY